MSFCVVLRLLCYLGFPLVAPKVMPVTKLPTDHLPLAEGALLCAEANAYLVQAQALAAVGQQVALLVYLL